MFTLAKCQGSMQCFKTITGSLVSKRNLFWLHQNCTKTQFSGHHHPLHLQLSEKDLKYAANPQDWETAHEIHGKSSVFGSLEQANSSSDKQNAINGCLLGYVLHSFLCSVTRMPNLKLWLKNVSVLTPTSQAILFDIVSLVSSVRQLSAHRPVKRMFHSITFWAYQPINENLWVRQPTLSCYSI